MITIIIIIIDYSLYGIKYEDAPFIMSVINKCFPFFKQHFTESWKPYACLSNVLWPQNPESSLDIHNWKQNQKLHIQKRKFAVLKTA